MNAHSSFVNDNLSTFFSSDDLGSLSNTMYCSTPSTVCFAVKLLEIFDNAVFIELFVSAITAPVLSFSLALSTESARSVRTTLDVIIWLRYLSPSGTVLSYMPSASLSRVVPVVTALVIFFVILSPLVMPLVPVSSMPTISAMPFNSLLHLTASLFIFVIAVFSSSSTVLFISTIGFSPTF